VTIVTVVTFGSMTGDIPLLVLIGRIHSHDERGISMAIDHDIETLIPFHAARSAFPGGRKLALQTLHRWRSPGVRGAKLETIIVGGLRYTSREAIGRFIAAQNCADKNPVNNITPSQRASQSKAARMALAEAGV
jgi:hypothetical protein